MLHDVEFVVDDAAVRGPLLDTQPVGFPHVHARRRDPHPLAGTQFLLEKLIQGFFLALPAKPYWLTGVQIADYGDELLLFP